MFLSNKRSNEHILERIILMIFFALFGVKVVSGLLALVDVKNLTIAYSIVILISVLILTIDILLKNSHIPLFLFSLSLYLLFTFCIFHSPTYLPLWMRVVSFLLFLLISIKAIEDLWTKKEYNFISQFKFINRTRFFMLILCISLSFEVFDAITENYIYLIFFIPIILIFLLSQNLLNAKISSKLFYPLFIGSTIAISIFNYSYLHDAYLYIPVLISIIFCFMLRDYFNERKTVLISAMIFLFQELYISISCLNIFPERYNFIVNIIGFTINLFSFITIFIKMPKKEILAKFVGKYSIDDMCNQIINYREKIKEENDFFGKEYIDALAYIKQYCDDFDKKIMKSLVNEAKNNDSIFIDESNETKSNRFISVLKKVGEFIELHWRAIVLVPLSIIYISISFSGVHMAISTKLLEKGKVFVPYEVIYYACDYTDKTLHMLSNGKDITDNVNFQTYLEKNLKIIEDNL